MKPIDNIISQVIESDHSEWHWITALNFERLGYSDDMIGCLEVVSISSEQPEKRIILSHDVDFDDFIASYRLSYLDKGGILK